MKISTQRLLQLLVPLGFAPSRAGKQAMSFYRPDVDKEVYQKIHVDFQGRSNEYVYGNVSSAVGKFVNLKIEVREHLLELDANKVRNWTCIESIPQAMEWEHRFTKVAPTAAANYANQHGPALIHRTSHARISAKNHLRQLDLSKTIPEQLQHLTTRYGHALRAEAQRLADWPGVLQLFDEADLYLLACFAVLIGEDGATFIGGDPLANDELMWQIQLVVDGLLTARL